VACATIAIALTNRGDVYRRNTEQQALRFDDAMTRPTYQWQRGIALGAFSRARQDEEAYWSAAGPVRAMCVLPEKRGHRRFSVGTNQDLRCPLLFASIGQPGVILVAHMLSTVTWIKKALRFWAIHARFLSAMRALHWTTERVRLLRLLRTVWGDDEEKASCDHEFHRR
jgi:hypothetical protein